jgi:hypothetical protein
MCPNERVQLPSDLVRGRASFQAWRKQWADGGDLALAVSDRFPLFSGRILEGFPKSLHVDVGMPV